MNLFEEWREIAGAEMNPREHKEFWDKYYGIEKEAYRKILSRGEDFYSGKLSALALEFGMSEPEFCGFIDGINTSLKKEYDLEKLKSGSDIYIKADFEKLYYNMLDAKASWLYSLAEWDDIFTAEKRESIRDKWRKDKQAVSTKIERNSPCPCGS